jgi:hypothetical protein
MKCMPLFVKCSRFGEIRLRYLAIVAPTNLDKVGYLPFPTRHSSLSADSEFAQIVSLKGRARTIPVNPSPPVANHKESGLPDGPISEGVQP